MYGLFLFFIFGKSQEKKKQFWYAYGQVAVN